MDLNKLTQADPASKQPVSVELPSGMGTVSVRRISRGERMRLMNEVGVGTDGRVKLPLWEWEQELLSRAMVDPKMTKKDVENWQENGSSGDIEKVTQVIQELANINASTNLEAAKSPPE